MTKEDKNLLIKDLCARLPYGVEIQVKEWTTVDTELKFGHIDRLQHDEIELKPFLRPMSSMTEEEWEEHDNFCDDCRGAEYFELIDWLNSHHFDYRNLIERGLAIAVTEENNPYKE